MFLNLKTFFENTKNIKLIFFKNCCSSLKIVFYVLSVLLKIKDIRKCVFFISLYVQKLQTVLKNCKQIDP